MNPITVIGQQHNDTINKKVLTGFMISYGGSFYFLHSNEQSNQYDFESFIQDINSDTLILLSGGLPFYEIEENILLKMKNIRVNSDDSTTTDKFKHLFIIPCKISYKTDLQNCSKDRYYSNMFSVNKDQLIKFTFDNNCIINTYIFLKRMNSVALSKEFKYNEELCKNAFYKSRPGVFDFSKKKTK